MQKFPMTQTGAKALQAELHRLITEERPKIIQAIAEARAHGDLKENAEYHAAREQQSFTEGRITEIESRLAAAQIIDISKIENTGRVIFGASVVLETQDGSEKQFQIVGEDEADIHLGKISITSPVARALIGKHEGDEVSVTVPEGESQYFIKRVSYV